MLRTMSGAKFTTFARDVAGGLIQTSASRHEKALAVLGQLAGAGVRPKTISDWLARGGPTRIPFRVPQRFL
jgi:hypothetical protein